MDVAVLGIRIENGDVVKATASLGGLEVASTKTEAATQRLGRRMGLLEIQARQMDEEMGRTGRTMGLLEIEARKMDAEYGQASRAMGLMEIEARKMDAAMQGVTGSIEHGTAAHEPHIHGLSRIGNSLAGLVGHATGVPPVIEKIADALAIMSFGHLATVGVLAGFAAIAFAYEKITEKAKEAAEEAEKSRAAIAESANAGRTDAIREAARTLQFGQPFDKEHKLVPLSEFAPGAFEGSLADLQGKLRALQEQFYATTNGFTQMQIQEQIIGVKKSLDPMEKLMKDMQAANANILTQPAEGAGILPRITVEAPSLEAIKKAREKAEKEAAEEAAKIFRASIEQRAEEYNHFLKEGENAYQRSLDETVKAFENSQKEIEAYEAHQRDVRLKQAQDENGALLKHWKNFGENIQRTMADTFTRVFEEGAGAFRNIFSVARSLMARLTGELISMFAARRLMPWLLGAMGMGGGGSRGFGAQMALEAGGGALAGGIVGYGVGSMTTNRGLGALSGALSGAGAGYLATGGSPIGAATGALMGFVGGILGAGNAAAEAAKQMQAFRTSALLTIESLRAVVAGDALGQAIAAVKAQFEAARQLVNAGYPAYPSQPEELERLRRIMELNDLEATRIQQLKDEAAAAKEVTAASVNMVQGYKYQAAIFAAMGAHGSALGIPPVFGAPPEFGGDFPSLPGSRPGAQSSGGSGDLSVTLVLQDGTVLGKTVLKSFKQRAQSQFGDTTRWAEIQ